MDVPTLTGRRTRLRPLAESDRARIIEIRRTEEVARRWRGDDLDAEFSEGLADDGVQQFAIEIDGGPDGEAVVGMIQFGEEEDPDYRHASVDLFVDPAVHRRGIASDAIATLVDHLFDVLDHHRVVIDPVVDNEPAIACYASVGFRPVGVMRSYERQADGSWADGLLMDLLRTDRPRD